MFADLIGFTAIAEAHGVERAYGITTGCLRLLDGIARQHGGSVDKYQGDSLMVVFGHPLPLEGAARSALVAALEMRQRVRDYDRELALDPPLDLHVGINTGALVAGDIRGPVVREFHVLGDTVNVAARLKAKSPPGAVYAGPGTREEVGDAFAFRDLEPMALKGKSKPVPVFELLEARERLHAAALGDGQRSLAAFVGREPELARLRAAVERLRAGHGGLVTLAGSEGIGKSRLLAELGAGGALAGLRVAQVRPPSTGERVPGELLAAIAEALSGDAHAAVDTGSAEQPLAAGDPAVAAQRSIAHATSRGPLLLAVEDLQRAGAASRAGLVALAPLVAERPLLLVAVGRSEAAPLLAELAAAARGAGTTRPAEIEAIELGPLPPADTRRLIDALAGDEPIPDAARALIEERAAGNPARLVMGVHLAPALGSESEHAAAQPERGSGAERRRATILFADITGFTRMTEALGPERAYPIVAGCLRLLDEVARRHGGTVDKYLGDCVMALFGVPHALEDAPRAAVNAAIEMRRRVHDYNRENDLPLPLDVHTGIHTGRSIAGDISGPLIREFAVMGEPVVAAAQLTDRAEAGQIFVGPETWRLTRERFDYQEQGAVEIHGRAGGIGAYQLLSDAEQLYRRRASAEREIFSELVGRDGELARLDARVAVLGDGRGGFVALVAEAGLGKSRLVEELARRAEGRVTWLEGRSLSTGSQLSFHPFADLLRSWAQVGDQDDADAVAAKLEAAIERVLPGELEETYPYLAALMGARMSAERRERLDASPGELLDKLIRARVTRLLQSAAAERPLVLVFDDLHWADLSSIELLEALAPLATAHPVLFVHVCRPRFAATSERVLAKLRAEHAGQLDVLELEPLGREALRLLINNLFRGAELPQRLRARIVEKAAGNPFYVEEVVRSLLEEGAVVRDGERFRATEKIETAEIPGTVQEVVQARIDRLPLRQRELVHAASVIGRSFHFEVLRQLFPDKDTLVDDLGALEAGGFVVPWDRLEGVEFAFKHPLIQEVAYDSLLEARREELHLAVGRAIETSLTENLPGYHAMLAFHYGKGRDLARAEEALFRAGDEAARSAASNEALQFFREASALYVALHPQGGDPAKRARLEKNIGLALHNRGQLIEAEAHIENALRLLGQYVAQSDRVLALRFVRNIVRVLRNLYLWPRRRRPASDVDREVVELMMKRAEAQTYVSPTRFLFDSIDTVQKLDDLDPATVPGAGGFYSGTVGIFTYGGLSQSVSRRFLAKARPLVRADDKTETLFFAAMNHMHHFFAGDWSDAHRLSDEAVQEGIRGMRLWSVVTHVQLVAEQHLRRGDWKRARESIALLSGLWDTYDYDYAKTNHYWLPTLLALEERRLPEAVRAAEAYFDEIPEDLLHILALSAKGLAQTLGGDLEIAGATLGKAARLVAAAKYPPVYQMSVYRAARFTFDVARLEEALRDGDTARARVRHREARRSSRAARAIAAKVAYWRPHVLRLEGRRLWLAGRVQPAQRIWRQSLAAAEALGTRPERARCAHELGLRLAARPDARSPGDRDAESWLAEARGLYVELGLDWDRARLEQGLYP